MGATSGAGAGDSETDPFPGGAEARCGSHGLAAAAALSGFVGSIGAFPG